MNLEYLVTFLEVMRLGSFSEAAKRLSLSQPAVSFQVQRLEKDVGTRLLERGDKGIMATPSGERFKKFAELVVAERKQLYQDIEQLREKVLGELSIVSSTIPSEYIVPRILGQFKAKFPDISATVTVFDSSLVLEKVHNGEFEVGFCGSSPEGYNLSFVKVAEDQIVLAVYSQHHLARRDQVIFDELIDEPFLFREETSGTHQSLKRLLAEAGFDLGGCRASFILGSTQSVVSSVEAGLGIAFVSDMAIQKSVELGLIKVVPVEGIQMRRDFYCVYRSQGVVSRLLREFIAFTHAG